jgi:nitronate monooxygenase
MLESVLLDELAIPVVLAPLGGGPSTPRLTAAVCDAGGLGTMASAYLSAEQTEKTLAETRAATSRPFAVNLFAPVAGPAPVELYADYVASLRAWAGERGVAIGEPRFGDDDWSAKIELLVAEPVAVVTFAFGCPDADTLGRLHEAGCETWVTVTAPEEAAEAVAAGADALIVQGAEAGGHRASFVDRVDLPLYGLLALLQLVRAELDVPLVASGGIATGAAVAAVLAAGARAAALGSAFMLAPEAGTADVHRRALRSPTPTALTRAFTGRLARGVRNGFIGEHEDAPIAYPEIHYATAPARRYGREHDDREIVNLWAGETHQLADELPAAQIVERIAAELEQALEAMRSLPRRADAR